MSRSPAADKSASALPSPIPDIDVFLLQGELQTVKQEAEASLILLQGELQTVEQEAEASLTTAKELAESQQKTSFIQSSSDSASVIKDDGSQATCTMR
jgi:hypothetical protein